MTTEAKTTAARSELVHWFEVLVTDLAKASRFYEALLATTLIPHREGNHDQALIPNASEPRPCGALVADPKRRPSAGAGAVVYLLARGGVVRTLARGVEAGGKVVLPATSIAPNGTIALIADPDGNVIGLHEEPQP